MVTSSYLYSKSTACVLLCLLQSLAFVVHNAHSFSVSPKNINTNAKIMQQTVIRQCSNDNDGHDGIEGIAGNDGIGNNRREFFAQLAQLSQSVPLAATTLALTLTLTTGPNDAANAGIDPSALKQFSTEGDATGAATRLRQLESTSTSASKTRPEDTLDIPFTKLPSGVSYREYREGTLINRVTGMSTPVIQPGSKVAVEMTIRCKSFATANDPGGVKYFTTRDDTDFNEIAWTVGSGDLPPGLEEGMMGMHKDAIRRIELPSEMVFAARKDGQLPLPKDTNKDGKRRYESLFKTDATLLFEVLVTRIK